MSTTQQIGLKVKNPRNIDVGRMVDSSQADDRKMIRLVKKRRLLYARNNLPVASQISQVKSLWQEVAFEMGWSVADVRRKWSHIRNSYSRHLRNEMHGARTGKGRMVSKWYLADELEFLREHMATDTRSSPYSAYAPRYLEMDMSESSSNPENVDVKPFLHNSWFTLPTPQTALNGFNVKQETNIQSDDSCSSQAFGPDENCSFFQFFRGIYNDYQELSNKKKRLFKRQCLSFLHDLLDEDDKQEIEINFHDQSDAINLSNSGHNSSIEENETKVPLFENIVATSIPTEEIIDE